MGSSKKNSSNLQENRRFISRLYSSKVEFLEQYKALYNDKVKSKQLYFLILSELKLAVSECSIERFKHFNNLLDFINVSENYLDLISYHDDESNPFKNTNLIILACQHNGVELLKYIFQNYSTILNNLNNKTNILPDDKDEAFHTAFYYAIHSNNVELLDILIEKWPGNYFSIHLDKLDEVLSDAYEEIKLRNIVLSEETEIFVANKLLNLRFFSDDCSKIQNHKTSGDHIKERIGIVLKNINSLSTIQNVDDKFLFTIKFIVQNISVLKQQLKSTYDRLPWEEIEFCLISFISNFKNEYKNFFAKTILNKNKILKYLADFAEKLESELSNILNLTINKLVVLPKINRDENIKNIINKDPQFVELYNDYQEICDLHSLEKINSYLQLISSANLEEKEGQLIIMRSLQIIGEYLKNTLESPKLSSFIGEFLLLCLPSDTRKVFTSLRESSYMYSIIRKIEDDANDNVDFFINIQDDIEKISEITAYTLDKNKTKAIKKLLHRLIKSKNSTELKEIETLFNEFSLELIVLKSMQTTEFENLERLIEALKHNVVDKNENEAQLFQQIDDIITFEKNKLKNLKTLYFSGFPTEYKLHVDLLNFDIESEDTKLTKKYIESALEKIDLKMNHDSLKKIALFSAEILRSNELKIKCDNFEEINRLTYEICHIVELEIDDFKYMKTLKEKFNHRSFFAEKGQTNHVSDDNYTSQLESKLSELKDIYINYSQRNGQKLNPLQSNKKLQAVLELLIFDIFSILEISKNYLENNLTFLDDNAPILTGKCLLNHLERDNALNNICLFNQTITVILNADKINTENLLKNKKKIGKLLREDPVKLKSRYNQGLVTILNQEKIFHDSEKEDLDSFKRCIAKGADINGRNMNLWTPLHFAAKGDNSEIVKFLLNRKSKVDAKDVNNQTPLHIAAVFGSKNVVNIFVKEKCIEIDDKDNRGRTPLHYAAESGNKDIVEILLKYGADANIKDKFGFSPLLNAVRNNCVDVVKLMGKEKYIHETTDGLILLRIAADRGFMDLVKYLLKLNAKSCAEIHTGVMPLHLAALKGHLKIADLLIANGSNVNVKIENGCTPLHHAAEHGQTEIVDLLLENGADLKLCDVRLNAPLHYAAKGGHLEIIKILLKRGADATAVNAENMSPIHLAIKHGYIEAVKVLFEHGAEKVNLFLQTAAENGHQDIVEFLIKHQADVNAEDYTNVAPLHKACLAGHKDIVSLLIENGATVNVKYTSGSTPLHAAVISGNKDIVEILIQSKADVKVRTNDGITPLHLAAKLGNVDIVKFLIKSKINPNIKDNNGSKPLHVAAQHCCEEVVELLIKSGASVNVNDQMGMTPLHVAVEANFKRIVEILLANKAAANSKNKYNITPLSSAIKNNNKEIIEILVANGADVNAEGGQAMLYAVLSGYRDIFQILSRNKARIDMKYANNMTLLHIATMKCYKDIVNILITKGMNVNCKNINNVTPLHIAAEKGHEEIIQLLISNGANVNAKISEGMTPLHVATTEGRLNVVKALLRSGVDVNVEDDENRTPLELAVAFSHSKIVKFLLQFKEVNVNRKGINDFTLLHIASCGGNLEITRQLIDSGADINAKNASGSKAVHIAAKEGHKEIIELFVNRGLNITELGTSNRSLLHYAAMRGQLKVSDYLIQLGADINFKDDNQRTPLHLAAKFSSKEFVEYLLKKGAIYNAVDESNRKPVELSDKEAIVTMLTATDKLFESVRQGNHSEVEKCLRTGAVVDAKNADNVATLHHAAWKGFEDIVDLLLNHKGNPNMIGKQGNSPLHYAAKFSHFKITKSLLANGAIYNAVSNLGKTPLDLTEDINIIYLLKLISESFENVEAGNTKVVNDLKKIKDFDILKALAGAVNRANQTLVAFADHCSFPKAEQLKEILLDDISDCIEQADMLIFEDRCQEALDIFKKVLKKRKKLSKFNSPNTLEIERRMSKLLFEEQRYEEALTMFEELYPKQKSALGENHKDTLATRVMTAFSLFKLGNSEESLMIYEEIDKKKKEFPDISDNSFLDINFNMALVLDNLKRYDEALESYKQVFEKQKSELSACHPVALITQHKIAAILEHQGKHNECLAAYKSIYESRKTLSGPTHPDTLGALDKLIALVEKRKKHGTFTIYDTDTIGAYEDLLEYQMANFGKNDIRTLNTQHSIALLLYIKGNYTSALNMFNECIEPREAILGPKDSEVALAKQVINRMNLALQLGSIVDVVVDDLERDTLTVGALQQLLRKVDSVNDEDENGNTLLHLAAQLGSVDIVNKLLEMKASVNKVSKEGKTPLHFACARGSRVIVETLLASASRVGAIELVNAKIAGTGDTCLHLTARAGHFELVKSLLIHGAMFDVENDEARLPLDISEDWQTVDLLKLLSELFEYARKGDDNLFIIVESLNLDLFRAVTSARDNKGQSLVQTVIANEHESLAKKLLKIIIN